MSLKARQETITVVTVGDLDEFIRGFFPKLFEDGYGVDLDLEIGPGDYAMADLSRRETPLDGDAEAIEHAERGEWSDFPITYALLEEIVRRGQLEPGKYLIERP